MSDYIQVKNIVAVLVRFLWLVIGLAIIGGFGGYLMSQKQTPVYEATTTILVGEILESTDLNRTDILTSELVATTYAEMVRRQPVMEGVVGSLGLDQDWRQLKSQVRVNLIEGTQLIQINVESSTPSKAQLIADEIATQLISFSPSQNQMQGTDNTQAFVQQQLENLQARLESGENRRALLDQQLANTRTTERLNAIQGEIDILDSLLTEWENNYTQLLIFLGNRQSPNNLTIIEPAQASTNQIRPNIRLYVLIGSGVGIFLAISLIFLFEYFDDSIKSSNEIQHGFNSQSLGTVPRISGVDNESKLAVIQDYLSSTSEVFRLIGGNLQLYNKVGNQKTFIVTSPNQSEGKSLITASLGTVLAQSGLSTIIVDANLRRPAVHELFHVENKKGLIDIISQEKFSIEDYLRDTQVENLRILSIGKTELNPSGLLMEHKVRPIISSLKKQADVILFDSSSVLDNADAMFLSTQMDGVLLIAASKRTKKDQLSKSIQNLEIAGANISGIVFNKYLPGRMRIMFNKVWSKYKNQATLKQKNLEMKPDSRTSITNLSESQESISG
ncbi:MAG: polysaccharide biosynthesis tyrosine autokinase [Anaerolineales bacterium]